MERIELVEQIIMIVAIATLLPIPFGYAASGWYLWVFLPLVLCVLLVIFSRKRRRLNAAFAEAKVFMENAGNPPTTLLIPLSGDAPSPTDDDPPK